MLRKQDIDENHVEFLLSSSSSLLLLLLALLAARRRLLFSSPNGRTVREGGMVQAFVSQAREKMIRDLRSCFLSPEPQLRVCGCAFCLAEGGVAYRSRG